MTSPARPVLPDPERSRQRGRSERAAAPRSSLSRLSERPANFDVVELIKRSSVGRLDDLTALRYERMIESPFNFFRGAAQIQSADLVRDGGTRLEVQLCGDAHLSNFGVFSSPEGHAVFDVNDFDETARGPFEWDVKRLAASVAIAGAAVNLTKPQIHDSVVAASSSYRMSMLEFARESTLSIWHTALDVDQVMKELDDFFTDEASTAVSDVMARAKSPGRRTFERMITRVDGVPQIVSNPPLLVRIESLGVGAGLGSSLDFLRGVLASYATTLSSDRQELLSQLTVVDGARKVVGVGSVGLRCYVVLLVGRDADDPFFLQIKEAGDSAIDANRGTPNELPPGERVVRGQRIIQATPDLLLGWCSAEDANGVARSYYVRQLYDNKASVNVKSLGAQSLAAYARACAWVLARAHARSGQAIAIAGYLGNSSNFDEAIATYANIFADRNREDWESLKKAQGNERLSGESAVAPS